MLADHSAPEHERVRHTVGRSFVSALDLLEYYSFYEAVVGRSHLAAGTEGDIFDRNGTFDASGPS